MPLPPALDIDELGLAWRTYSKRKEAADAADMNTPAGRELAGKAMDAMRAYLRASRAFFG